MKSKPAHYRHRSGYVRGVSPRRIAAPFAPRSATRSRPPLIGSSGEWVMAQVERGGGGGEGSIRPAVVCPSWSMMAAWEIEMRCTTRPGSWVTCRYGVAWPKPIGPAGRRAWTIQCCPGPKRARPVVDDSRRWSGASRPRREWPCAAQGPRVIASGVPGVLSSARTACSTGPTLQPLRGARIRVTDEPTRRFMPAKRRGSVGRQARDACVCGHALYGSLRQGRLTSQLMKPLRGGRVDPGDQASWDDRERPCTRSTCASPTTPASTILQGKRTWRWREILRQPTEASDIGPGQNAPARPARCRASRSSRWPATPARKAIRRAQGLTHWANDSGPARGVTLEFRLPHEQQVYANTREGRASRRRAKPFARSPTWA